MPGDTNNYSFNDDDNSEDNDHELDPEVEELRKQISAIQKKLTGENPVPVTNNDILQFVRIINYNFVSLTKLLQAILLKTAEMDSTLMNLELGTVRINNRLQQFFETNSMLDDIGEEDLNGSGSAPGSKFIF